MSVWIALSAPLATVVTGLVVMVLDALGPQRSAEIQGRASDLGILTAVGLFGSAALAIAVWLEGTPAVLPDAIRGLIAVDRFGLFVWATVAVGGGLCSLLCAGYLDEHGLDRGEYYPLIAFSCFGAMLLGAATDLVVQFVSLETMSLAVYCLVGLRRGSVRSQEAALKYFLLGSFAAAFFLLGLALLYVETGSTRAAEVAAALRGQGGGAALAIVAATMLLTGLGFKISAVPFHMWTPDAYEGAPTPVTAFMSVVVKAAAFAALLRVLFQFFGGSELESQAGWPQILAFFAVASMCVGNLVALRQTNVKRMLAYSSIAHAGYILVGVLATWKGQEAGRAAVLFYLLSYTLMNVGAFAAVAYLGRRGAESVHFDDFSGAARRHPAAAMALAFFMISLTGMPPSAGFFAKLYVFQSAIDAGMWALVLVAVLNSAVSAYYYLRLVILMYMRQPEPGAPAAERMKNGMVATVVVLCALAVLQLGLWPSRILSMALDSAW